MLADPSQRIGIVGGSFDPIHSGHLAIAHASVQQLQLDTVYFMPCKTPPHKTGFHTDDKHRLAMLRLACEAQPQFKVDTRELQQARMSYSVLSLGDIRREYGASIALYFIIGWDAFQSLPSWYEWQRVFELTNLIVAKRPGYSGVQDAQLERCVRLREVSLTQVQTHTLGKLAFIDNNSLPFSSTMIRKSLSQSDAAIAHESIPSAVYDYINQYGLYQKPHD